MARSTLELISWHAAPTSKGSDPLSGEAIRACGRPIFDVLCAWIRTRPRRASGTVEVDQAPGARHGVARANPLPRRRGPNTAGCGNLRPSPGSGHQPTAPRPTPAADNGSSMTPPAGRVGRRRGRSDPVAPRDCTSITRFVISARKSRVPVPLSAQPTICATRCEHHRDEARARVVCARGGVGALSRRGPVISIVCRRWLRARPSHPP